MTSALIAFVVVVAFIVVWMVSGGKDKVRLVIGALLGFALAGSIGGFVMGALGGFMKVVGGLFGVS